MRREDGAQDVLQTVSNRLELRPPMSLEQISRLRRAAGGGAAAAEDAENAAPAHLVEKNGKGLSSTSPLMPGRPANAPLSQAAAAATVGAERSTGSRGVEDVLRTVDLSKLRAHRLWASRAGKDAEAEAGDQRRQPLGGAATTASPLVEATASRRDAQSTPAPRLREGSDYGSGSSSDDEVDAALSNWRQFLGVVGPKPAAPAKASSRQSGVAALRSAAEMLPGSATGGALQLQPLPSPPAAAAAPGSSPASPPGASPRSISGMSIVHPLGGPTVPATSTPIKVASASPGSTVSPSANMATSPANMATSPANTATSISTITR